MPHLSNLHRKYLQLNQILLYSLGASTNSVESTYLGHRNPERFVIQVFAITCSINISLQQCLDFGTFGCQV